MIDIDTYFESHYCQRYCAIIVAETVLIWQLLRDCDWAEDYPDQDSSHVNTNKLLMQTEGQNRSEL